MDSMVGSYLYLFLVLALLVVLGVKMYLRTRIRIESNRPALPISEADILAAIRARRLPEAIQLYGLLHRCDLVQATLAVQAMATQLPSVQAENADSTQPEEVPGDHRDT
jgi:hypothetical protein